MLIFKIFLRVFVFFGLYGVLARVCRRYVSEIALDGSLGPLNRHYDRDKTTILILSREHIRGDVKILSSQDSLRCLDLNQTFQRFLLECFVPPSTEEDIETHRFTIGVRGAFRCAEPGTKIYSCREKYRSFLRLFLPHLFEMCGVDLVINSDERYRREADITRVSSELGYPHVSIQRESMFVVPATYNDAVARHKVYGKFHGDLMIVQNEVTRHVFIESGYAKNSQVKICGCMRMDNFLERLRAKDGLRKQDRKQVLMFSWPGGKHVSNKYYVDLFDAAKESVKAFSRLAMKRPDVDFIVKFKDKHTKGGAEGQFERLKKIAHEVVGDFEAIPNLKFYTEHMSAADLIMESSVVCAMQSSTVLEAAVSGKPVILPHFRFLRERKGADEVLMYRNNYNLFDVPDDENDLERLILWRLEDANISEETMDGRRKLFDDYISPLSGGATACVVKLLKEAGRKRAGI